MRQLIFWDEVHYHHSRCLPSLKLAAKAASSPLKLGHPKRKRWSFNHPGAKLFDQPGPARLTAAPTTCKVPQDLAEDHVYMDVSENSGTPKSSILIGFSIINHPFWGTPIFGNTHITL